jgi:glycosidase
VVDQRFGGPNGLAIARQELARRGMNLVLDFVLNHVAPEHLLVIEHPEYFIRENADSARRDPASFMDAEGNVCACGRDPHSPAWPDVLQLNAFGQGFGKQRLKPSQVSPVSAMAFDAIWRCFY